MIDALKLTTETTKETTEQKSIYGNKSEDYYIFHQDEYDTFHLRGMGKGYGATKARMDSGDYDISIKIPTNYWVNATSIRENDVKEAIRWNDTLEKIDSNNKVREDDRMSLEDIENNSIDFRDRGGKQNPSYMSIKRITTRKSVLCTSKRTEREVRLIPILG